MKRKITKLAWKVFDRESYALEYVSLTTTLAMVVILGLLLIADYSGLSVSAGVHNASAGTITELEFIETLPTVMWAGLYGFALRIPTFDESQSETVTAGVFDDRTDIFFDCIESGASGGNEVYATTAGNISWGTLSAGTVAMVDEFLNFTSPGGAANKSDSAANTFTSTMTVYVGSTQITNVPSTYTYKQSEPATVYDIGVLNDSTNLVFVTHIASGVQKGYSPNISVNFQLLLPVPENTTQTYNFFTDPNDYCPAGGIGEAVNASVYGYVTDTSGNFLQSVTITFVGYSTTSDSAGWYNLTDVQVIPGTYNVIAEKTDYDINVTSVTIAFVSPDVENNITMPPLTEGRNITVTPIVSGFVTDSSGNALQGANVSLNGVTNDSDASGHYTLEPTLNVGRHWIVAVLSGYDNYVGNITFEENDTLVSHNITMTVANPYTTGPYATGPYSSTYTYATGPYTTEGRVTREMRIPPRVERPEGVEVFVPTKEINRKVLLNTFLDEPVDIYNFKGSPITTTFSISDSLKSVVTLDKTSLTVNPESWAALILTIYGNELGDYNGTLTLAGDIIQSIPVVIKVVEKKYPIETLLIRMELLDRILTPGSELNYKVGLQNLLTDQRYKVNLNYAVTGLNSTTPYLTEDEEIEIQTTANLLKQFLLPKDMEAGEYILRINAKYLGLTSTLSTKFLVSKPIYLYAIFGIPLWMLMIGVALLSSGTFSASLYKRYLESKKRFRVELDFKALPQAGPRSAYVGKIAETDVRAYIDLDKLTTHMIIAGATGRGKTVAAQDIVEEALARGIAVMVVDPTAQWSGMLRKCKDKRMLGLYPDFGMKPGDAKAYNGNVKQINDAREVLDIKKYIRPGEVQVLSIHKLDPKDADIFVANTIREIFHSSPVEQRELKTLVIYDEVHRLLPKFGGSGEGFIQIERACREFRKWGIGVILISQVLSDFVGAIKANINTEIQTRTIDEGDLERIKTKYGEGILKSLVRAGVGVAMVQNAEYNKGRPYFINFRPILHGITRVSDEELDNYNKYNIVIEDLDYQIEQLEAENVDIFDLRLELKLALDKVKSGNFNMVDIYLEGLKPRLESQWTKIGKKPKKKIVQLVDEIALKKSLEEAKRAREKYEAERKVEESKTEKKEEDIFKKNVAPFTFNNGMMVSSLQELKEVFELMDEDLFKTHVNEKKNDIADWVKNSGFTDLAEDLSRAKTKDEMYKILGEAQKNKDKKTKKPEEKKEEKKPEPEKKKEEKKEEKKGEQPKEEQDVKKPEEKKEEKTETQKPANAQTEKTNDLKLSNGKVIKTLEDLSASLKEMSDDTLVEHFNKEKNDFAKWVREEIKDESLANMLDKAKTKEELIILLDRHLNKKE